jgi:ABC-2 type transport system ATP-binding protein
VALGIIHEPKIVFLDEPTTGLDPQSRAHMWDEVRRLRDEGVTIFLTTHYLDEADALCDRISIMDGGEIVADGTPENLKREISGDVVTLGVAAGVVEKACEVLDREPARALFNGNPGDPNVWKSLVILGVLTVLSVVWAARSFAKSVR